MSEYDPAAQAQKQLEQTQKSLEAFKDKLFERFEDYILGMAVLPKRNPEALPEEVKKEYDEHAVATLILLDDSDTKRLSKQELKEKLGGIFESTAKDIDKNIQPEVLLLSELWELCMDAKYDVLQDIALSQIFYDVGMLQAVKLVELHKQMVLKKFEKYIVAYVLGGSLVQGTATTKSDVDVFIVIDDTDVKKMTRTELRDKLRAIITDLGHQAGEMTGIKNKINIQVYILTDFWDNIKEANPVIFTFLRDGIPFYDRGIFMPWKQLLEMGRIKPSQEAIDQFMTYGDQYLKRVKVKLKEIGVDDFFWATVTPSQSAIMLLGHAPPTPKELCQVMRELFVKEKKLEAKYVDYLEHILTVRKAIEHGDKADVSGKDIDELYEKAEAYIKRLNKLFEEIQENKDKEVVLHTYENAVTLVRDVLQSEGHDVKDSDLIDVFEQELVSAGNIPEKFIRILKDIHEAKKKFDKNDLTRTEASEIQQDGREFFKHMLEYLQRQRGKELEQAKMRVQHGDSVGELLIVEDTVYVIYDLGVEEKEYQKITKTKTGWSKPKQSSLEEYETALAEAQELPPAKLDSNLFIRIQDIFGDDAQVLL